MKYCTDGEFKQIVEASASIADVLRTLQRARSGASYDWVRKGVTRLGLDVSHWGVNRQTLVRELIPWSKVLVKNSPYRIITGRKKRLIREGLLENRCAVCGHDPEWEGKSLTLVLDHINGNRSDHRLENLRLVCPNCDSQLLTFCGRNIVITKTPTFCVCGTEIGKRSTQCRSCAAKEVNKEREKIDWPSTDELRRMVGQTSYLAVGRHLGVSDNAVRKRLRNH